MPGQLVLELGVAPTQNFELALSRRALLSVLGSQSRQGTDVSGPLPFDDVARVQALSAQEGAFAPVLGDPFVLLQDRQLVVGAELAPLGSGRRIVFGHGPILGACRHRC